MLIRLAHYVMMALVVALSAGSVVAPVARLPVRATFTAGSLEHTWTLADLNPQLPADWTPYEFLVLEFRASSSQRFDLGIEMTRGRSREAHRPVRRRLGARRDSTRVLPPAGRRCAGDLAATYNQPRGSYWINIHSDAVRPDHRHVAR